MSINNRKMTFDFSNAINPNEICDQLNDRIWEVANELCADDYVQDMGEEIRIGNKGSLTINTSDDREKIGSWYSFEKKDGGGNLLSFFYYVAFGL